MMTTAEIFNRADLSKVSTEDMEKVNVLMSDFIEMAGKAYDKEVNLLKMEIEMLLCEHVSKEIAEKTVAMFKNEDGTTGQHWTYDQTSEVLKTSGKSYNPVEFYYAMNKIYSDYYCSKYTAEDYVRMAGQYLTDKDGGVDKVKNAIIDMWK